MKSGTNLVCQTHNVGKEFSQGQAAEVLKVVERRRREVGPDEEVEFEGGGFPVGKKVYVSCDAT